MLISWSPSSIFLKNSKTVQNQLESSYYSIENIFDQFEIKHFNVET